MARVSKSKMSGNTGGGLSAGMAGIPGTVRTETRNGSIMMGDAVAWLAGNRSIDHGVIGSIDAIDAIAAALSAPDAERILGVLKDRGSRAAWRELVARLRDGASAKAGELCRMLDGVMSKRTMARNAQFLPPVELLERIAIDVCRLTGRPYRGLDRKLWWNPQTGYTDTARAVALEVYFSLGVGLGGYRGIRFRKGAVCAVPSAMFEAIGCGAEGDGTGSGESEFESPDDDFEGMGEIDLDGETELESMGEIGIDGSELEPELESLDDVPLCAMGQAIHDWRSPRELCGGSVDRPGVVVAGPHARVKCVCARCGCYRETIRYREGGWEDVDSGGIDGVNATAGADVLESVLYLLPDDESLGWVEGLKASCQIKDADLIECISCGKMRGAEHCHDGVCEYCQLDEMKDAESTG